MTKNVGSLDKTIRFAIALVLFSLFFVLEGNARFLSLVGLVPLLTGLISFCPLYSLLGLCTSKKTS